VSWNFNDKELQSMYYCIYFCVRRSRGIDMCNIVCSFTSDTGLNDVVVHAYVNKRTWFSNNNMFYSTYNYLSYQTVHSTSLAG